MKIITLLFSTIIFFNCEAVVQSVGPGGKVTVDQWGGKFITHEYRNLKSNKDCWNKLHEDKIILTDY